MIINSRMERRLSIAATAVLTAAIFVMPISTRAFHDAKGQRAKFATVADCSAHQAVVPQIKFIQLINATGRTWRSGSYDGA
jgi:hypothetical protein